LNLLGVLQQQLGHIDEAQTLLEQAIALRGDVAAYHGNLGALLSKSGNPAQAIVALQRALTLSPEDADSHYNLGVAANKAGESALAQSALTRAAALRPKHAPTWLTLGHVLRERDDISAAQDAYQRALALDAQQSRAWFGLALCADASGKPEDAEQAYLQALAISPDFEKPHHNLGNYYLRLRQIDRAIEHYRQALRLQPDYAEAHYHLAHALFMQGEVALAWDEYAWRLKMPRFAASGGIRAYQKPLWQGEPLNGRRLHIYREQGVGDEVMFAQCLRDVQAAGIHASVECEPRLKPLLTRSFAGLKIVGSDEVAPDDESGFDVQCPMGSLPGLFRRSLASLQQCAPYLQADPKAIAYWRERFASLPQAMTVGIAWRGGGDTAQKALRSIALPAWQSLFELPVNFVSLQYGDHQQEIDAFNSVTTQVLHQFPEVDPLRDLDGQAAQLAALDLLISIDNATVHLAGALGTPVWALLPHAAEWRWGDASQALWYSRLTLFQQTEAGDWGTPMTAVHAGLFKRCGKR
jgi:tetratricopeptide (TPR) repeat protein